MPVLLIAIVLAGVLYFAVPNEHERESYLKPVRHAMMAAVGLIER